MVYNTLHISPIWHLRWAHLKVGSRTHIGPYCSLCSRLLPSCIFGTLGVPQVCILKYVCIWGATWEICDTVYHLLSNPCMDLQYMALHSCWYWRLSCWIWRYVQNLMGMERYFMIFLLFRARQLFIGFYHLFLRLRWWSGSLCRTFGSVSHFGSLYLLNAGFFLFHVEVVYFNLRLNVCLHKWDTTPWYMYTPTLLTNSIYTIYPWYGWVMKITSQYWLLFPRSIHIYIYICQSRDCHIFSLVTVLGNMYNLCKTSFINMHV